MVRKQILNEINKQNEDLCKKKNILPRLFFFSINASTKRLHYYTRQKIFLLPVHAERVRRGLKNIVLGRTESLKSVVLKSTFVAVEHCCPEKDRFL